MKESKIHQNNFRRLFRSLSIRQKIAFGYAIALGVALTGSIVGLLIGTYYYQQAELQMADAQEEKRLPFQFQNELLRTRMHRKEAIALLEKPDLMQQEYANYQYHANQVKQSWAALKASYNAPTVEESDEEQALFQQMVREYDRAVEEYFRQADALFQQAQLANLKPADIPVIRARLLEFSLHPISLKLRNLVQDLDEIIALATEEEQQAAVALRQAEQLERQIIAISLVSAIALATLLAWFISRTITHPLRSTTRIAEQVIQEQNFDLQAPVTTHDEVGILTTILNQLIQQVKHLLLQQKAAEAQLIQAEKMSSLGQLVAGIAHEINNPVSFIHGNLPYAGEYIQQLLHLVRLYEQHYPMPPPTLQAEIEAMDLEFVKEDATKLFRSMRVGTNRIREIVLALRIFSRLDEAEFKIVDIHEGIDSTLLILNNRLKAKPNHSEIEIIRDYGQLPLVECYPGQLNQVFINLLTNAIDALEESCVKGDCSLVNDTKQIAPDVGQTTPPTVHIWTEVVETKWVAIHIADNGSGMSEVVRSRLFDPFFTTKPVGKGTGLGLSISYQIVTEKHKGKLECFSKPEQGTEFIITIPIRQS